MHRQGKVQQERNTGGACSVTRLLVDGVFFQLENTGIARVWRMLLSSLSGLNDLEIMLLDRGNAPRIDGVEYVTFREYNEAAGTADDSIEIQKVCDRLNIDVFSSTYYTTPLHTPMLLVVYDMIPELFTYELRHRPWMEKQMAISYAQRFLCISEKTRSDLLSIYPEIPAERAEVAYCGIDPNVFCRRPSADIESFSTMYGLNRPYYLFVGSRGTKDNYKNSWLFFESLKSVESGDFDVFCVGGEPLIEPDILAYLPEGVGCTRATLTDDELALAYGGATALVYPSLYEGFGMPVIEAMSCGCPVITTNHGSLAEAAGDAAILVGGACTDEMRQALARVRDTEVRNDVQARGFQQASRFRWKNMAESFEQSVRLLRSEASDGMFERFFREWQLIRQTQARFEREH